MRTTLTINDDILRELRAQAAASGRSLREVVNQSLTIGLAYLARPAARRRFRVRSHRLALKPGFRGVSMNQLYDQIESERGL